LCKILGVSDVAFQGGLSSGVCRKWQESSSFDPKMIQVLITLGRWKTIPPRLIEWQGCASAQKVFFRLWRSRLLNRM
jgi:hypothetical protein